MMKQRMCFRVLVSLLLLLVWCGSSAAAPALTDGQTVAWIGSDRHLHLMDGSGYTDNIPLTVQDLLSISGSEVYCLLNNGQIYAVRKDGSGASLVGKATAEGVPAKWLDQRALYRDGNLTMGLTTVPNVAAWTTDGSHVFAVMQQGAERRLGVFTLDGAPWPEGDASIRLPAGEAVPEPLSMTAVQDILVITKTDHSLWTVDLTTGEVYPVSAIGQQTAAAAVIGGEIYRYSFSSNDGWLLEQTEVSAAGQAHRNTVTPVPTAAATAVPQATAVPTTATAKDTDDGDDGLIHKGDRGDRVRDMQRRLIELGYLSGAADGIYGESTQQALARFYDAMGQRERTYLTAKAEDLLFSGSAPAYDPYRPLKKGDKGASVLRLQQKLAQLGFDPGRQDGVYGAQTVAAVQRYMAARGLQPGHGEVPGENIPRDVLMQIFAEEAAAVAIPAAVQWMEEQGGWACYLSGVRATGWQKIDKKWYYFNPSGIMQTGWISDGGDWYFTNDKGVMQTGWLKNRGDWFYLDKSGKMMRGWFEDEEAEKKAKDGKKLWYWFDENGRMATGEQLIDGKVEVFNEKGVWQKTKKPK